MPTYTEKYATCTLCWKMWQYAKYAAIAYSHKTDMPTAYPAVLLTALDEFSVKRWDGEGRGKRQVRFRGSMIRPSFNAADILLLVHHHTDIYIVDVITCYGRLLHGQLHRPQITIVTRQMYTVQQTIPRTAQFDNDMLAPFLSHFAGSRNYFLHNVKQIPSQLLTFMF